MSDEKLVKLIESTIEIAVVNHLASSNFNNLDIGRLDKRIDSLFKKSISNGENLARLLGEVSSFPKSMEDLTKEVKNLSTDIVSLKVKSGLWGLAAGMIPASLILIKVWLENRFS